MLIRTDGKLVRMEAIQGYVEEFCKKKQHQNFKKD